MGRMAGWALYALMTAALVGLLLWYRGVFLPPSQDRSAGLSLEDGTVLELTLADGSFCAECGGQPLWQSGRGLHVEDFLTFDIDRDGSTELVLLVWRRGNYGSSKPFWVKRNDTNWSQHIFIYDWRDNTFLPQWMSSQLRPQVARWALHDDNQLFILTPDGTETLWQWGQWGLVRTA